MIARRASVLALAVAAAATVMLAGCDGSPQPAETTPLFGSEQEAFAAAEQTYRDYVEAGNARASDPSSEADPLTYLVGDALEAETASSATPSDVSTDGSIELLWFEVVDASPSYVRLSVESCLDLTRTRLLNANGEDVTPANRPDRVGIRAGLVWVGSAYKIEELAASAGEGREC